MRKTSKARRLGTLLLAAALALPVFGATGASAASADPAPAAGASYSKPDYFSARYPALAGKEHVFDTLTYHELDYLLRKEAGTHIILFGGSWQPETQKAIGYINDVAKEYGVTSIRNFDPKLDGPDGWIDITKQDSKPAVTAVNASTGSDLTGEGARTDFSVRYADLAWRYLTNLADQLPGNAPKISVTYPEITGNNGQTSKTETVPVVGSPFLFIYNKDHKNGGSAAPIISSLDGIAALTDADGGEAYKNALRGVFDAISPAGTKNAQYDVFTNQSYISGSYNEFSGTAGTDSPIFGNEDLPIVINSVTTDELKYLLETDNTIPVIIGCAWCGNTQAGIKYVNRIAKEYGVTTVYNWDAKLDGGLDSTPGRTYKAVVSGYGDFLHTRVSNKQISPVYVNLVKQYLPNLSEHVQYFPDASGKHNNDIVYGYKNAEGALAVGRASRLQAPYVFVYDKRSESAPILGHVELMYSWSNTKNPEHANTLTYINGLRTLYSRIEWKPAGLSGAAPTTAGGSDGKILGIAKKALEYRAKNEATYTAVPGAGNEITGLTPGVYEVRYAAKNGVDTAATLRQSAYAPGPAVEVVVPEYQAAPSGLLGLAPEEANGNGKIVLVENDELKPLPSGLEYKLEEANESAYAPVQGDALSLEPDRFYEIRYAAKTAEGIYYGPSAAQTVYVPGYKQLAPPSALEAVHPSSLANDDGQITGLTAGAEYKVEYRLEYKKGADEAVQYAIVPDEAIAAGKLTGLSPDVYSVRYAVYEDNSPSRAVSLVIKANVAAPQGLAGVAPTGSTQNNGKITGTSTALEYRANGQTVYQPAAGQEIAGLLTGDYFVRFKETATTLPSADTKVTVPAYTAPSTGGNNGGGDGSGNGGGSGTGTGEGNGAGTGQTDGISQSGGSTVATVPAKLDAETGRAIAVITPALASGLLDKAKQAEAKGEKAVLELKVESTEQSGKIQVTVPRAAFNELVAGTKAEVKINAGFGTITFDANALKTIGASGDAGDISFILTKSELTKEGKDVLGDRPVYDLLVYAGQTGITAFGGSKIAVSLPYTLQPGEDANAVIVYHVTEEGELHLIKGRYNAAAGAVEFQTEHFSQYIIGYNKISFTDVVPAAWFAPAVTYLAAREITSGTDENHFSPNANVTRGQFIVLLLNAYGIQPDAAGAVNFADAGNTYYTGHLAAAKRLGIANGLEENKFAPDQSISRQDLFTLLYRALSVLGELPAAQAGAASVAGFADAADIAGYANEAFKALVEAGVISGNNGKLLPKDAASRAEVAQVLYNLLKD
ncbi:S-layer homology domain-containing protein [Paenibacillus contaminans]|uniref:SLH domain-containing protein n=1 Tax=Paenibacillus contaminans TaxID=450362 RepID=A0A329MIM3_9BACL|nr:S-layer homology domain-containing protein [Paenibacillus contaminans]RAV19560.1 hypothetical protein DQG23_19025 [Paenibacillus contaminans]